MIRPLKIVLLASQHILCLIHPCSTYTLLKGICLPLPLRPEWPTC